MGIHPKHPALRGPGCFSTIVARMACAGEFLTVHVAEFVHMVIEGLEGTMGRIKLRPCRVGAKGPPASRVESRPPPPVGRERSYFMSRHSGPPTYRMWQHSVSIDGGPLALPLAPDGWPLRGHIGSRAVPCVGGAGVAGDHTPGTSPTSTLRGTPAQPPRI